MEMIDSKLINLNTHSIISYFVNGFEHTIVNEGHEEEFYVKVSPDEFVNHSFLQIGNTLKGATEAARKKINQKYKQSPVVLCPRNNIALIKCKIPHPFGCVWLIEAKIKDIFPYQNNQTSVLMKDGSTIIVDMKCKELQHNREQASYLCKTFLEGSNFEDSTMTDTDHLSKKKRRHLSLTQGRQNLKNKSHT